MEFTGFPRNPSRDRRDKKWMDGWKVESEESAFHWGEAVLELLWLFTVADLAF